MKCHQSCTPLQLNRRREREQRLSAITRSDKSLPASGEGAQHPGRQAGSLPGGRGGRIHTWQGGRRWSAGKGDTVLPQFMRVPAGLDAGITQHRFRAPCHLPQRDAQPDTRTHTAHACRLGSEKTFIFVITRLQRSDHSLQEKPDSTSPHSWVFSDSRLRFPLQTNTPLPSPAIQLTRNLAQRWVFLIFLSHSSCRLCMGEGRGNKPPAWFVQTVGREVPIESTEAVAALRRSGQGLPEADSSARVPL